MTSLFGTRRACQLIRVLGTAVLGSLVLATGALADGASPPGTFVVGNLEGMTLGAHVTFWGAQWWKDNPLSTGFAPPSFKGYAMTSLPPACDQPWTADPGNSTPPPDTVDTTQPVPMIVSSTITKSGPVISGDTVAVALVKVDPGTYGPNPGHAGTGTIVGYACGGPPPQNPPPPQARDLGSHARPAHVHGRRRHRPSGRHTRAR
jgi:hypothetical protein